MNGTTMIVNMSGGNRPLISALPSNETQDQRSRVRGIRWIAWLDGSWWRQLGLIRSEAKVKKDIFRFCS